jgi:peptidoglycan/xylan/chitin deacetylase (PgdA/CDA1 family)
LKHNIVTFTAVTIFALSGIIFWETGFAWLVMLLIALIYFTILAYGSFKIQANYYLTSINKGKRKSVALTFDDGPDEDNTPKILQILREKDVKATFFVIGKKAEKYPDIIRQINEEGHTLANHSYSHSYLIAFFSTKRLKADLLRCNEVITGIIEKSPLFFRPPFGVTNPRYATVIKELQLNSIGWSLRSLDTRAKNKYQLISRILAVLQKRDIILLHDNLPVTADALEDIIEHCVQKGIKIEPLPQLIDKNPYGKTPDHF